MGNVINGAYSICVQDPPEEAEMKRSRTTSADEDQDLEQGESSAEPTGPMERLIAAASAGLESVQMPETGKSNVADLMCSHCHSMLFRVRFGCKIALFSCYQIHLYFKQPSTLVDGRTVCLPCAPKVKEMPAQGLSFGSKANTVLDAVAKGIKKVVSFV